MVISPQTHYGLSPFKLDAQISKFLSWIVLPCYQIGSDLANKKKKKKKKLKWKQFSLICHVDQDQKIFHRFPTMTLGKAFPESPHHFQECVPL